VLTQPRIEVIDDPDYRTIIVNGVFGGHKPGFLEAVVYTDEWVVKEALATLDAPLDKIYIKRTLKCRLVIDPFTAKSVADWLTTHIKQYEESFGKIEAPKDKTLNQDRTVARTV
jgi:hypothetical protein